MMALVYQHSALVTQFTWPSSIGITFFTKRLIPIMHACKYSRTTIFLGPEGVYYSEMFIMLKAIENAMCEKVCNHNCTCHHSFSDITEVLSIVSSVIAKFHCVLFIENTNV